MRLVPYAGADLDSMATAPGWPHADTGAGLAFTATGGWTWLILDDDDRVAGECGTKAPPGPDGVVEIGYGLAGPSRGRGLGTRAVAALVAELAQRPGVRVIEADVDADNVASRRVLERSGFDVDDVLGGTVRYRRLV